MEGLYIGLISGTSIDAIDAVIVRQTKERQEIIDSLTFPWPIALQQQIRLLCQPGENEIDQMGVLDIEVGQVFARAANQLVSQHQIDPKEIVAIGSHGQTIRHRPEADHPFTLQIGDPNQIAANTGISVVADFRRRDMAYGGQGAPLAPAFHQYQFRSIEENRVVLNLGGIANVSLLPKDSSTKVVGFDTGPASTLLDLWAKKHLQQPYDESGKWAESGTPHLGLLKAMLDDPYFTEIAPKSTGPEYFSPSWLETHLADRPDITPCDVQATLTQLTVKSITKEISDHAPETHRVIACGGGVHNKHLMTSLSQALLGIPLETTSKHGTDPDFVEAAAFAWLAYQTISRRPGNLPLVTGAKQSTILGGVYPI